MTDPRKPVFDAVRTIAPSRLFNDAGNILALNNLLDAFGAQREGAPAAPPARTGLSKSGAFFGTLREGKYLGPALSEDEVSGCEAIMAACGLAGWPIADTAYALATAWHETASTMQPIHELGGPAYLRRMYDIEGARPAKARELGNHRPGDGVRYAGRGYVQLTGRDNYVRAGSALGIPLDAEPDLAMDPGHAAAIMVRGMAEGWFTGRDIDDDLPRQGPGALAQFVRSRDIINGSDKAETIAQAAIHFQAALVVGGWC
jgi:putative chitinase